jgi:hypothetical protein
MVLLGEGGMLPEEVIASAADSELAAETDSSASDISSDLADQGILAVLA